MRNIAIPSEISFYKTYEPGTYANLSVEERKFYLDLIKNSKSKCCQDFMNLNAEDFDIQDNVHEFFSDMSRHINGIFDNLFCGCSLFATDYFGSYYANPNTHCDDFTIDEWDYKSIDWITWDEEQHRFEIEVQNDQSVDYLYFDRIDFIDDNKIYEYIEEWIKNKMENYHYSTELFIKYNKKYHPFICKCFRKYYHGNLNLDEV